MRKKKAREKSLGTLYTEMASKLDDEIEKTTSLTLKLRDAEEAFSRIRDEWNFGEDEYLEHGGFRSHRWEPEGMRGHKMDVIAREAMRRIRVPDPEMRAREDYREGN